MKQGETEKRLGYTCGCGAFHRADNWVAAHWDEVLDHTCKVCSVKNTIKRGRILRTVKARITQEAS